MNLCALVGLCAVVSAAAASCPDASNPNSSSCPLKAETSFVPCRSTCSLQVSSPSSNLLSLVLGVHICLWAYVTNLKLPDEKNSKQEANAHCATGRASKDHPCGVYSCRLAHPLGKIHTLAHTVTLYACFVMNRGVLDRTQCWFADDQIVRTSWSHCGLRQGCLWRHPHLRPGKGQPAEGTRRVSSEKRRSWVRQSGALCLQADNLPPLENTTKLQAVVRQHLHRLQADSPRATLALSHCGLCVSSIQTT